MERPRVRKGHIKPGQNCNYGRVNVNYVSGCSNSAADLSGDAFLADLSKFKGNHQAEDLVVEIVKGRTGALTAFQILQRWEYALAETDFALIRV